MTPRVREGLRTVGFMCALSGVLIACVSALYLATEERVRRNADLFLQRAVMEVAGVPVPRDAAAVAEWFRGSVEASPAGAPTEFRVRDAATGAERARAYLRKGSGLWGPITAVIGMAPDRRSFLQLRILEQNETPGLGARIAELWFMRQTEGKSGPFRLVPEGSRSAAPTEIDAVTGATITCAAVLDMLNGLLREGAPQKEAAK